MFAVELKLARQKQLLNETLRQQEQYKQSVHDIGDRLDAIQKTMDGLKQLESRNHTAEELEKYVQNAEVFDIFRNRSIVTYQYIELIYVFRNQNAG